MNLPIHEDDMPVNGGTYPSIWDGTAPHHIGKAEHLKHSHIRFLPHDDREPVNTQK